MAFIATIIPNFSYKSPITSYTDTHVYPDFGFYYPDFMLTKNGGGCERALMEESGVVIQLLEPDISFIQFRLGPSK